MPTRSLGIAAATITATLFGAVSLVVVVVASRDPSSSLPPTPVPPGPPAGPVRAVPPERPGAEESRLACEIAAHPFWKAKLTEADVLGLAERVRGEKGTSVVYIDDAANLAVEYVPGSLGHYRDPAVRHAWKPAGIGRRYVFFLLSDEFPARPRLAEVLRRLLGKVSVTDYRS